MTRDSERIAWACPHCGDPGYIVDSRPWGLAILRCGNEGCPDTREFDPAKGEQITPPRD